MGPEGRRIRVAVVGGGVAGALLAWRLTEGWPSVSVDVFTGSGAADATAASGGLVRGFETDPAAGRLAAESLAELHGDARLRDWTGFREVGSVYLLAGVDDPAAAALRTVDELLPGSAEVVPARRLVTDYPFRELAAGTVGIVERRAGYVSPAGLRSAVLDHLAIGGTGAADGAGGAVVRREPVTAVTPPSTVRLAGGATVGYDAVVVAAGAWTPRLLVASGLSGDGFRVRHIQYAQYDVRLPGLGVFVDDESGFYGRPAGEPGSFLLGLPSPHWDIDPAAAAPDAELAEQVLAHARRTFGVPVTACTPPRVVSAFDCYHRPAGLALRTVATGSALFTFTGGSGGAAKTVLAASRVAAGALMGELIG